MTEEQAFAERVGRWLRDRRAAIGLKQGDVARELGVSASAVSQWERGRGNMGAYSLYRLKKLLRREDCQPAGD